MPLCDEFVTNCQNFDFKIWRDHQKISYERRDYESVDEKKPILSYVLKNDEKKNSGSKGLICACVTHKFLMESAVH